MSPSTFSFFYFSSSSSKWDIVISVPLLDFFSSFDKAVEVIFEAVTAENQSDIQKGIFTKLNPINS